MFPTLLAVALSFSDPAGDARGDGGYLLPTHPPLTESMLDLRAFSAEPRGDGMRFTVTLGQIGNPWGAPGGYSAGVTDIFIKTAAGGQSVLDGTGLTVRSGGGWQYHLRVSGFGSRLERSVLQPQADRPQSNTPGTNTPGTNGSATQRLPAPTLSVEGTSLVVDAAVPPGRYAYWVTNSVYTPLSADGVLRPSTAQSPFALRAGRENAPAPVDVLAPAGDTLAFSAGTLAPLGQTRDSSTLALAGVGGLGLLLTAGATWLSRRSGH